jgi:ferredoxin--NADP+ reductase
MREGTALYPIVRKQELNETTTLMTVEAPMVARKAKPGQFIIFRIDEEGERVPLTIAGYDREKGTVTIIFQRVGYTTEKLNSLEEGDALLDFVGPLGEPSATEGIRRAAVIGGGTMGLLHVMLAKLRGVRVILLSPERRTAQSRLSVRQPPCSARIFSILPR